MTLEWTEEMESNFLGSFIGDKAVYRPVGPSKHFAMLCAYDRFCKTLPPNTKMDIESMWTKLETYYDLDALEKDEKVPFPNETVEFSLPPGWVEDKDSKNNEKYCDPQEDSAPTPGQADSSTPKKPKKKKVIN